MDIDFNPHTREGCDVYAAKNQGGIELISIHTPAKGATFDLCCNCPDTKISIHTPAKGATHKAIRSG